MKKLFLTAVAVVAFSFPSGASPNHQFNFVNADNFVFNDCTDYSFDVMETYAALGYSDHDIMVAGNLAYAICFLNME